MKASDCKAARLALALLLGGLLWLPPGGVGAQAVAPRYVMQNITADSKTSRTISWQTEGAEPLSSIEYGILGEKKTRRQAARLRPFRTDEGMIFLHAVTLEQLTPGRSYRYRVGASGRWSEWFTLDTETGGAFQALIFPDSQCVDYAVWEKTAAAARRRCPDARLFINLGDLVDNGEHWYQWRRWLDGAAAMMARIPAAPIAGNHEAYSLRWIFTPPATYLGLFTLPRNGAPGLAEQSYSFDYGPVHFVALDTQAEELAAFQPDLIARQAEWLARDLAATQQPWIVVLLHRPVIGYPAADGPNDLGKALIPLFDRYGVDLVLQAHLHSYSRSGPLRAGRPAGRGTVYIGAGRSGDDAWNQVPRKMSDLVFDDVMDQPNYLTLAADEERLEIRSVKQDGTLIDAFTLRAKPREIAADGGILPRRAEMLAKGKAASGGALAENAPAAAAKGD